MKSEEEGCEIRAESIMRGAIVARIGRRGEDD